jgi:hypothetical protein
VPVPPPVPPMPMGPVDPLALKPRWSAPLPDTFYGQKHMSEANNLLLASSSREGVVAFNLATGAARNGFAGLGRVVGLHPLDGGQVASWKVNGTELVLWDEKTGQEVGKLPVPELPPVVGKGVGVHAVLSPNQKCLVVAVSGIPLTNAGDQPFLVYDAVTKKKLLSTTWKGGRIHFTADSSRVLAAEWNGRCRWFKSTGLPDGEWQLDGDLVNGRHHDVTSMSADGSVLGYNGPTGRGRNSQGPAVLDGTTGKVLHLFDKDYHYTSPVIVSADGRRVAVNRVTEGGMARVDVTDSRTGAVIARAAVDFSVPSCLLSRDGSMLVIFAGQARKVQVYDVPGGPAGPKPPEPKAPGPVGAAGELKEKWSAAIKTKVETGDPYFDRDGQSVVVTARGGVPWGIAALNARTGAALGALEGLRSNLYRLVPMENGKVGYQNTFDKEIVVWDPVTGTMTPQKFDPPPGAGNGTVFANISPNGQYLTVGFPRLGPGPRPGADRIESPLHVLNPAGKLLFTVDWFVGRTLFTADSSRVLVVDDTDRFRWYDLTTGKIDGEWKFGRPADGFNAKVPSMSAKGEVILYEGQPPGKEESFHLLNGKDGTVLHSFPAKRYHPTGGSVSDDGRFVSFVRNDGFGTGHTVEVLDARGTLLGSVKIPPAGRGTTMVATSWKARILVLYERKTQQMTAYELPIP